jgi:Xaa-Pro aminopeptidase
VAHAVEATGRGVAPGDTEEEVAGQVGHRLIHHNVEVASISVAADDRGAKFRRAGFTAAPVTRSCVLQATGQRDGLYATASRTVYFGTPPDEFRAAFDSAAKLAAIYRAYTEPGATVARVAEVAAALLVGTPFEFDGRLSQPGYGAGHFAAEELRRAGQDDPLAAGQALVWQPRVGPAASADTVLVTPAGPPESITPPAEWPFKRITVRGVTSDIPDLLVRKDAG